MSLVLIKDHNENIFNVIATPTDHVVVKEEVYESHAYKKLLSERKDPRKNQKRGTFGLPHLPRPDPHNFLKKRTFKPPMFPLDVIDPDHGKHRRVKVARLIPTPMRDDVLKEQDEKLSRWRPKNMIKKNIEYAIKMIPKVPERVTMIDNKGTRIPLKPGLEPTFVPTPAYGNLPPYLEHLAKQREKNRLKQEQIADSFQPICRYLIRDKRRSLLEGLKQNWAELQRLYSVLPTVTDTIPKITRKSKLEADLKQLEADIVLLERHPYIYIYPDDDLDKKA
ncbi:enkurin-like [Onthophagus taurus]|uniref:enkurin-like n=1 Tax=Onthophagus taurus TaxID=166361 RepID=UPI000C20BF00|nr:enkurin-like [Onthophagus taurus]